MHVVAQSSLPPTLLLNAGLVAVVVVVIWLVARASKSTWQRAHALAQRLGLVIEPADITLGLFYGPPSATGVIRQKAVRLFSYTTQSGKNKVHWRAISATPRTNGGLSLALTPQGLGSKFLALLGAKEVKVGDPEFDRRWSIETNHPEFLARGLRPELRAQFTEASRQTHSPSLKVVDGVVVYAEKGRFDSEATSGRFESLAALVCDVADAVEIFSANKS